MVGRQREKIPPADRPIVVTLKPKGGPCLSAESWSALLLRQDDFIWLIWAEMVLGPFAETKGPRLPGRNPVLKNAMDKPQQIEEGLCNGEEWQNLPKK
ncbi:MAG: hypothetical protein NPIRA03_40160 [Nitrospirales bacterium]|nr:MAG: hypothetical protein NPIRA03_40160 [Nitrospirales bacterium]